MRTAPQNPPPPDRFPPTSIWEVKYTVEAPLMLNAKKQPSNAPIFLLSVMTGKRTAELIEGNRARVDTHALRFGWKFTNRCDSEELTAPAEVVMTNMQKRTTEHNAIIQMRIRDLIARMQSQAMLHGLGSKEDGRLFLVAEPQKHNHHTPPGQGVLQLEDPATNTNGIDLTLDRRSAVFAATYIVRSKLTKAILCGEASPGFVLVMRQPTSGD